MLEQETRGLNLYSCKTETTLRKLMYMDDAGQMYENDYTF